MQRLVLLLFSVLSLTLGFSLAHSTLETSSIADGSTVTEAPGEITLVFTEELEVRFSTFKIYPLDVDLSAVDAPARVEHKETGDDHGTEQAEGSEAQSDEGGHGAEQAEGGDHSEDGGHGVLDAAAEALVAEKLEARDEATRPGLVVTPANGTSTQVTLALSGALEPGAYVVMWRALSVDGHAQDGFLTFVYQPDTAQTTP